MVMFQDRLFGINDVNCSWNCWCEKHSKSEKGNLPGHTLTVEGGSASWLKLQREERDVLGIKDAQQLYDSSFKTTCSLYYLYAREVVFWPLPNCLFVCKQENTNNYLTDFHNTWWKDALWVFSAGQGLFFNLFYHFSQGIIHGSWWKKKEIWCSLIESKGTVWALAEVCAPLSVILVTLFLP